MAENNSSAPLKTAEGAVQRDELLQAAIDFIGTLTGMKPPPIEVAPPEVFAPFHAFVERVQAITRKPQAVAAQAAPAAAAYGDGFMEAVNEMDGLYEVVPLATPAKPATEDSSAEVQAEPVADDYPHEQMDALALARYKVVPSDQSMYWRHAVVAGDGNQHLYNGSEVDCQNMARKFAGAFLDGAFAFHERHTAPQAQPADALDVDESPSIHADPLWKWFGLSYASWLTLPRVLMHAMPIDWKADMARLLKRWDETWKAGNLPDIRIQAVGDNGKITKMPEWLNNYRHPDRAGLENIKEPSARTSQDRAAMAAAQEGGKA